LRALAMRSELGVITHNMSAERRVGDVPRHVYRQSAGHGPRPSHHRRSQSAFSELGEHARLRTKGPNEDAKPINVIGLAIDAEVRKDLCAAEMIDRLRQR
jgi:hypothetical protein